MFPYPTPSPEHTLSLGHPSLWLISLPAFHHWDTTSSLSPPRPTCRISLEWGFCLLNVHHTLPMDYRWAAVINYFTLSTLRIAWTLLEFNSSVHITAVCKTLQIKINLLTLTNKAFLIWPLLIFLDSFWPFRDIRPEHFCSFLERSFLSICSSLGPFLNGLSLFPQPGCGIGTARKHWPA